MDHTNRSVINNQLRRPRSSHSKPEWQKTAIRTCGHWSEQLSSKGKIYFYNCMTEVSQWQKPLEWNLPDISKKDILKLQNGVRDGEDHEHCKKTKLSSQPMRLNTNDDMDISPNSSPLSDSYSNSKSQSPQKHQPMPYAFQKPQVFGPKLSTNSNNSFNPVSTTLCQLVDAIRASIDGFLDQSPRSASLQLADRVSPSSNGALYSGLKTEESKPVLSTVPNVDGKFVKNQDLSQLSTHKIGSSNVCGVYSPKQKPTLYTKSFNCNSRINHSSEFQKDYNGPRSDYPNSLTKMDRVPTIRNNQIISPNIVSPHSSNTTLSHTNTPVHASLRGCTTPLHQSDEMQDGFPRKGFQSLTKNRIEASPKVFTHNSKEHPSETDSTLNSSHDPLLNRLRADEVGSIDTRSQNTQLNDLVQVLKVALQQTNQTQPSSSGSRNVSSRTLNPHSDDLRASTLDQKHNSQKDTSYKQQSGGLRNSFTEQHYSTSDSHSNTLPEISQSPKVNYSSAMIANTQLSSSRFESLLPSDSSKTVSPTFASTSEALTKKRTPNEAGVDSTVCCTETQLTSSLDSSEMRAFVEPLLVTVYLDESLQRMEQEAHMEAKNFDRLQSVLYAELSAESKKLRALVRISEAKLAIHEEKKNALQQLMDTIEVRKHLPNLSFVDDAL